MACVLSMRRHCSRAGKVRLFEDVEGEQVMSVKPIPEGYHSVTPYLIVRGGAAAIDFYKRAFGAVELFRFPAPDGKVGHAEIKIGDSPIMLADEYPQMGYNGPQTRHEADRSGAAAPSPGGVRR